MTSGISSPTRMPTTSSTQVRIDHPPPVSSDPASTVTPPPFPLVAGGVPVAGVEPVPGTVPVPGTAVVGGGSVLAVGVLAGGTSSWISLPPGASVDFPAAAYTFRYHQILVLTGTLTLIEGGFEHTLGKGDCLELGAPAPVTYANRAARP